MTDLKIVPTLTLADFVIQAAEYEAIAASSVAAIKDLTGEKNGAKIAAYSHIIAGLVSHKVRKGTKQAGEVKAALVERGVSPATAKRYMENGQKAKAIAWVKAAGSDSAAILAAFEENDVDDAALQALLDAAALLNPGCADVANTLVAALAAASAPLDLAA